MLPTDTVYGVGADAFDPQAVAAVLAAKGRGRDVPPPVLVPSVRTLDGLAMDVSPAARELVAAFWPGPLTIVCRAAPTLDWDLGDTGGTVALRMPLHRVALAVLELTGPMAVTSANRHGQPPATTVDEADGPARRRRQRLPRRRRRARRRPPRPSSTSPAPCRACCAPGPSRSSGCAPWPATSRAWPRQ